MKLRPKQNSTQPRIFDGGYEHPWYKYKIAKDCPEDMRKPVYNLLLNKPNPPSKEAVERAKFRDKTYHWSRDNSVRPRDERSST